MTERERFLRCMKFKDTDRIPLNADIVHMYDLQSYFTRDIKLIIGGEPDISAAILQKVTDF